ncbi:MAG: diacylglycerol/lipid kinase family protein [Gaiellaceae bacterium]
MAKVAFLVNPAAANGRTGRRWPELAHRAARAGLDGPAFLSQRAGHLVQLAQEASAQGAERVVVVGGDGTVNEVVRGLLERHEQGEPIPEIAVIPQGTGRDFARTFSLPRDTAGALETANSGEVQLIDAARVSYQSWQGGREHSYFANVASAGMSGAIAERANTTTKALGGKASFLMATLSVFSRWQPGEMTVTVDGTERHAAMHDVLVANCRFLGGGMKMCPEADPTDGQFDVLTIGAITKADLTRTLPKIYRGTHLPHPKAELLRGSKVAIDAKVPVPIQLDGEQPGTTPVTFDVIPQALRLRVPHAGSFA